MPDDSHHSAHLRAVLNAAVDCIITIDDCGTIESFNPATERTFGYASDEVIGQNVSILMPPPYCDEHDRHLKNYLETGVAKIIGIGREIIARRKDGSNFPADIAVSEVKISDRWLFTGIIRDITDRKRNEEKLLQSERLAAIG